MYSILQKALHAQELSLEEGVFLYEHAPLAELMFAANEVRKIHRPTGVVTWIIDRNVNIGNVCVSRCKFCNFHCLPGSEKSYLTSFEEYDEKIAVLEALGGNQLLIQGGMNPRLGLNFYVHLFSELKRRHPNILLHALGPPEIAYIAQREKTAPIDVLKTLHAAGLDSLPGAGAEILVDRVRRIVSPGKCSAQTWLSIMHDAHTLGLCTSATMMYGHIETTTERIQHLIAIRDLQNRRPAHSEGFTAFIPWVFYSKGTALAAEFPRNYAIRSAEYVRMIAISRIMLPNIANIQASWLTVGLPTAQLCLHAGAHDLGSIMIEENVVSQAGAGFSTNAEELKHAIIQAGFTPKLRNQQYEIIDF
ncbi:MAG: CofH family radical SAM protein [Bacteroidales bacterium]|jgi:cyclic dehypoxanthinyl futalosine synthase|nr:CofH family radical SAM protein [Bacteroidales bacterium]